VSARLAVVYIDGERRHLMESGDEAMARFVGPRASQHARGGEKVTGEEAEL
jgi:hypothetical protein